MTFTGTTRNSLTLIADLATGMLQGYTPLSRNLSSMRGMFHDTAAFERMLAREDTRVYDFFDIKRPELDTELAVGTSIVYPGKVGDEYFMTKGHFHTVLDTAEVYYCMSGRGLLLMESPEGDWEVSELAPGRAAYVPGRYAHRSINISSDKPLMFFFCFRADAGHDYATIETKGFRKLVVERNGAPEIIDNPHWK